MRSPYGGGGFAPRRFSREPTKTPYGGFDPKPGNQHNYGRMSRQEIHARFGLEAIQRKVDGITPAEL